MPVAVTHSGCKLRTHSVWCASGRPHSVWCASGRHLLCMVCQLPSQKAYGSYGCMTVLMMPLPLSALNSATPSLSCSMRKSRRPWMDIITALLVRGRISIDIWNWCPTENRDPEGNEARGTGAPYRTDTLRATRHVELVPHREPRP